MTVIEITNAIYMKILIKIHNIPVDMLMQVWSNNLINMLNFEKQQK